MTTVEWYEIEINLLIELYETKQIPQREFITIKHNLFYKAKEMEKQQIMQAVYDSMGTNFDPNMGRAELYYNEKFKSE